MSWDGLTAWHPSAGWPAAVVLLALAYLVAVIVLRRRGVAWSAGRVVAWLLGLASLVVVTSTGLATLGMALFSVHMAQHMVLSMLTPILLLLGAPITLTLRILPASGPTGAPRRVLLRVLHSRVAKVFSHPVFTVTAFVVSLFGLYFTDLLDVAMRTHVGHQVMLVHFLTVGLLFFGPILAVDPWPRRSAPGLRLVELLIAVPFHAVFGVVVMQAGYPLSTMFAASTTALGLDPIADQATGGGIAWGFGETPIVLVTAIVFVQWVRADTRAARRFDRQAARDGDAALAAYNDRLQRLSARQSPSN
ncbi:cytochrome c oxidase assembly protein [Kribbella sp. NPDC026611]|uniref:cytochrome c oxidase assembly protein n=1 Tax=Kribbella sp. NPDC026611 TaxID=3154911 RepID=UPI0033E89CC6